MNFLRKLFPGSFSSPKPEINQQLVYAINQWFHDDSRKNFDKVFDILTGDEAVLFLLPPYEGNQRKEVTGNDYGIQLMGVLDRDGKRTLMAYTSERILYEQTKSVSYIRLPANTVLSRCEPNNITKIVIITDLMQMFVIEWKEN